MPPRRSSRTTRASVPPEQPEQAPMLPTSKRKRTAEPQIDEKENVEKPPPRTRRSSATVAPRVSTRSRGSLKEVTEIDEEDAGDRTAPPSKKARPSPEIEDKEEEIRPQRVRATRRSSAAPSRSQGGVSTTETRDLKDIPQPTSRKVSTRRGDTEAGSTTRARSLRSAPSHVEVELVEVEEDEAEEDDKPQSRKARSKVSVKSRARQSRSSNKKSAEGESADEMVVEVGKECVSPAPIDVERGVNDDIPSIGDTDVPSNFNSSRAKGQHRVGSHDERVSDSEQEGEDLLNVHPSSSSRPRDNATPIPNSPILNSSEETSLLDPPSMPSQSNPPLVQEDKPKGPVPRLVIHKMALVNFKSYAGRQEIGPFHKSFSSIVGPNGSGKSNTIDALLFVFGYRASKMRQGKLSELIHNSARFEDLQECSVEVHFRDIIDLPGPDAYKVIPGTSLVVARTAYKNNSSKYAINGRSSNFSEVQSLLKGRGIDLDHKRFLILQGEVESIAQMKPKAQNEHEDGLLEYLEDIIGTSKYKEPIDEALTEMETLTESRTEKLGRLRIVEKEKNRLEEGKKEAEDWLRLQNEHVRALSRLWQWYLWKCLLNEEEFDRKIAHIEKELADETERNKDDITHLEMLEKHYEERVQTYEEVKTAAAEAAKDLSTHEKKEVGLEERRKHANGKAKKLKKAIQDDQHAKAEAQRTLEDSLNKMEREKKKVEQFEADLDKEEKLLEGIRDSLKDKTQVFHDQIEVKQKELQPWTAKLNSKQAEIDVAQSERDALAKKAEALKEAAKEADEVFEKLQGDHQAKIAESEELSTRKTTLQKEIRSGEKRLQDARAHVQELRTKASSSRQKHDEAKASQAANTSQNKVLDSLTRLKNAGRIDGFHGRLGSLGTIPDKYDVAVSTACGALHNLVVDTVEQGQACIEYLRKQNVGRASFLVLNKLSQTNGLEKISTPENVPRLFDLVKPKEPRFAPAFFKGVGNTLVAEDLEQANRIAFGGQRRWRVVTLAGQLIDSSGTMSGGGNHVARGGMSSKLAAETVSPEVLLGYERDSEEAVQQLERMQQELRKVELEIEDLTKSGPQIDMALEKINLDIKTGSKRIADAEKRVRELKSQSKPNAGDMARISTLEEEIASSSEELEELQKKAGKIEQAIKDLEKKILDIGGAKLLTQKSKVDGIRLHINLANDEITKAEVAKAKAEKDTVKFDHSIQANSTGLEEVERELKELTEQLEECAKYVSQLRGKVEDAQSVAENSKDDLEELKNEVDKKRGEIQKFRQKEMELQQSLNDTKREAGENERALDHWRTEHDKLKLEDIDDDEDEDDAHPAAQPQAETVGAAGTSGDQVKDEPGVDVVPKKERRPHTPSYELHIYSVEELAKFKKREMIADAELLDEKLKSAKPNLNVLKDYRKREEEFLKRAKDLEHITQLRDEQKQKYDNLRKQRLDEFMAGFSLISMKLKEMYQMITLGGNAELELVDSMDPFSEGIIFSVMPPKKSWKNISNLSGGEKTLSSLALVFALHVFKPTPLYFMDEIDAALDFRNVSIVANYIKDRTKNAQFIIISLRNDMFELSHRLIGIYKTANATQSISIDNRALTTVPVTTKATA